MCGALMAHLSNANEDFQPMGSNMGLLPPLPEPGCRDKRLRYQQIALRAVDAMKHYLRAEGIAAEE